MKNQSQKSLSSNQKVFSSKTSTWWYYTRYQTSCYKAIKKIVVKYL